MVVGAKAMNRDSAQVGAQGGRELAVEYERKFARAFLIPSKRDRFLRLASARGLPSRTNQAGLKHWAKYRQMLPNLEHDLLEEVTLSAQQTSTLTMEQVLDRLERLRAPDDCYAMSVSKTIDGRFLPLADAIHSLSDGDSHTALLICSPDSLAYYWHGEAAAVSAILRKGTKC